MTKERGVCGGVAIFLGVTSVVLGGVGSYFIGELEKHDNDRLHRVKFELAAVFDEVTHARTDDRWILELETGVFNHQEVHCRLFKKDTPNTNCHESVIKGPADTTGLLSLFEKMAWTTADAIPDPQSRANLFGIPHFEVLAAASSFSDSVIGNMTDLIGTNVSVDPTFELVGAPPGFDPSCGSTPSTHQLSYAAALALAPPNVRETVLMRILETAVLLHGTTLPSSDRLDAECFFVGYVDLARALRNAADSLETSSMVVVLFGILMMVALVPTVVAATQDPPPSPLYQTGLLLSLGLSVGIYCYLVSSIAVSARDLVDHVSGSGVPSGCLETSTTTSTHHNLAEIDGTLFGATATAAVAFLIAAILAMSSHSSSSGKGYVGVITLVQTLGRS